jgi:hypothetical protein
MEQSYLQQGFISYCSFSPTPYASCTNHLVLDAVFSTVTVMVLYEALEHSLHAIFFHCSCIFEIQELTVTLIVEHCN